MRRTALAVALRLHRRCPRSPARRMRCREIRHRDRQRHRHRFRRGDRGQSGPSRSPAPRTRRASSTSRAGALASSSGRTTAASSSSRRPRRIPSFAMAHYQLAANSATAKDFFAHLKQAVGAVRQGLGRRAADDPGARGRREREPGQGARVPEGARGQVSRTTSGPTSSSAAATSASRSTTRRSSSTRRRSRSTRRIRPPTTCWATPTAPVEKYAEAEAAFKKYIELIPGDPNPYDSYAELLMKTGRFDESIAQYQKALERRSELHAVKGRHRDQPHAPGQARRRRAQEMDELYRAARDDGDRRNALFTKGVIFVGRGQDRRGGRGDREGIRARRQAGRLGEHERRCPAPRQHPARCRPHRRGREAVLAGARPGREVEPVGRGQAGHQARRPLQRRPGRAGQGGPAEGEDGGAGVRGGRGGAARTTSAFARRTS